MSCNMTTVCLKIVNFDSPTPSGYLVVWYMWYLYYDISAMASLPWQHPGKGSTARLRQCSKDNTGMALQLEIAVDMHLRPIHTSIMDIFKVFEPLVCCLKAIWVHPYAVTPAKLAPDLGILGRLWSENDVITSWFRLISTSDRFPNTQ